MRLNLKKLWITTISAVRLTSATKKLGYKIREAQLKKTPYMLVVGDKEAQDGTVSVRSRKDGDLGISKTEDFCCKKLLKKSKQKAR
ncbi:MAG: His/Gly/Thr/Pro-type tRNA ligase C-terminal domain-containing protein [Clostridiales bacterium]|nr:MAG: His/Gly/Thr/Pro-type tRNA ligase C-terminal domain-containing protein [Clostridiales bacterium]